MKKKLKRQSRYLKLFHGTKPTNVARILRDGLQPSRDWYYGDDFDAEIRVLAEPDAVYLAKTYWDARYQGGPAVFKVVIPKTWVFKKRVMNALPEVLVLRTIPARYLKLEPARPIGCTRFIPSKSPRRD